MKIHRSSIGGAVEAFAHGNGKGAELMISPAPVSNNLTIAIFT